MNFHGFVSCNGVQMPGAVLRLWLELRRRVGVVEARKKEGVRFKVRSADELVDKVREAANDLGLLIYPSPGVVVGAASAVSKGVGHIVEDGTLAEQELVVVAQAVEDGSCLAFFGFGLGADTQDKAGGKAGTYAFKAALIQALLAGGKENAKVLGVVDTDDTDTPIEGGVRKKTRSRAPDLEDVRAALGLVTTEEQRQAAIRLVVALPPDKQLALRDDLRGAKERVATQGRQEP